MARKQLRLRPQSLPLHQQLLRKWFRDSWTLVLARGTILTGFLTGLVGVMDWSPLVGLGASTDFSQKQVIYLAGIMVLQGIGVEVARRRPGSTDPV